MARRGLLDWVTNRDVLVSNVETIRQLEGRLEEQENLVSLQGETLGEFKEKVDALETYFNYMERMVDRYMPFLKEKEKKEEIDDE